MYLGNCNKRDFGLNKSLYLNKSLIGIMFLRRYPLEIMFLILASSKSQKQEAITDKTLERCEKVVILPQFSHLPLPIF